MNRTNAYIAARLFTGVNMLTDYAVVVEDGYTKEIIPRQMLQPGISCVDLGNTLLVPAFVDLQLYGAFGRLLSLYPDAETMECIYRYSREGGASHCLPTVATQPYEVIFKCIDAVRDYQEAGGKGVPGLHVEGPWINPVKRGAHNEGWIHVPDIRQVKHLLEYGKNIIKIITLAPELCDPAIVQLIQSQGIIVSAGHSNATYGQALQAFSEGITTGTHLYNAMSALQHREPGLAGAIMDDDRVSCSIVPDGYHVSYPAIRIAKKVMGSRLFAITDAVTTTTSGFYQHVFEGDRYTANGILSGSALTMNKIVTNLVKHASIPLEEALRMCSLYPAKVLLHPGITGTIAKDTPFYAAVLGDDMQVVQVID